MAIASTLAAGGCCDCGKGKAAATPSSAAADLRAVPFAADVPAAQPKLPDVPPKVPDGPPPIPPPAPLPVAPPKPGLPEQPPPPQKPDDPKDLADKLRGQNGELQRKLDEAAARSGTIKHVVVLWLKKPGDKDGRKALLDGKEALRSIPGVIDVAAGECLPSERKVVDSSYDVALVVTLKDEAALKAYGPHPTHQKLIADVIKPYVEKYVVYDFVAK